MPNRNLLLILCLGCSLLGCSAKTSEGAKPAATSEGANQQVATSEAAKPTAAPATVVYEKNGFTCVAELCVGDGISELQGIQWEKAAIREGDNNEGVRESINRKFRGNIANEAVPYLQGQKFDATVLPLLSGVTALCDKSSPTSLSGKYTSKSGNITFVYIALRPKNEDATEQQWTVIQITRHFDVADTQRKETIAQLTERYKKFVPPVDLYKATEKAVFSTEDGVVGGDYFVDLKLGFSLPYRVKLEKLPIHPLCVKKINLE